MEEISDSRSISETEEWGMRGLHLGSKGPVVGKETDNVQQGSCPFVLEDDGEGVYVVDENWGNSCAVEGVEHTGGPNLSDNNGATGEGYYCDGENGGVFLVGEDWNDENLEGDGDNGGGDKILVDTNDDILKMGDLSFFSPHEIERYEFGSVDIAYKFYFEYGFANGFGIRKGRTLKNNKTLEEYQKELMCCRAGQREDRGLKLEDRVREPRALTRCDCKARFHVRVNRFSGRWFCICFEDEHNHDRLGALHCSMLPVYRKMSESDVVQMNNMMKVGIRPPNIFNMFANQSGGYEKIGFQKKDMYNKISEQRRSSCSDAKGALEYLENTWVAALYEKRNMWATAYLRGKFFGGFRTTSRCEGLHSELGKFVNSRYNLSDFLQHFQRCLNHMRFKEKGDDFTSIHGEPLIQTELQGMELSAANVYTRRVFFLFRRVLMRAQNLSVSGISQALRCTIFLVVSETGRSEEWRVCLYDNSKEIKCACLRMESRGLPCEHIVCVLAHLGIDEIPEILVLKRWSKAAKDGLGCKEFEANHCVDVGRRARKAALDGLYDHVSDFKSASIEMFKAERDRLVEDWRQCRADFESEQNLGLGGPTYTHDGPRNPTRASTKGHAGTSTSAGIRTRKKQNCSICKLPGHNKVTYPSSNQPWHYSHLHSAGGSSQQNAADAQTAEEYDYFDPESWL
ncbi:Zinc finger, PMZ-type [Sesbania bispinosa]|nr:Zinc finger, PMZ-type [Sesbania bispinosa]